MTALATLVTPLAIIYACWVCYVFVMALSRAKNRGTLSKTALVLGSPLLVLGLILDVLVNVLSSVIFLDYPREWLTTTRLQRYSDYNTDFRRTIALWIAHDLLDTFDPSGRHIR